MFSVLRNQRKKPWWGVITLFYNLHRRLGFYLLYISKQQCCGYVTSIYHLTEIEDIELMQIALASSTVSLCSDLPLGGLLLTMPERRGNASARRAFCYPTTSSICSNWTISIFSSLMWGASGARLYANLLRIPSIWPSAVTNWGGESGGGGSGRVLLSSSVAH